MLKRGTPVRLPDGAGRVSLTTGDGRPILVLAGRFVAYVTTTVEVSEPSRDSVRVMDLRRKRPSIATPASTLRFVGAVLVSQLVLRDNGAAAWIVYTSEGFRAEGPSKYEVMRVPSTAKSAELLDSATLESDSMQPIDPTSLTLSPLTKAITWRHDGAERTSPLR
jgi:hypothetical protein